MMWDISSILACPYCKTALGYNLPLIECGDCGRQYHQQNGMFYMYDSATDHWRKCKEQISALFRLDYTDSWKPRHDNLEYPYAGLETAGLGQQANAAMFNIVLELIGDRLYQDGYGIDVGSYNGWGAFRLADWMPTVALDCSDHPCYGMGAVPSVGCGVEKVVADGCYLPFSENSFNVLFMASAFHHMHDKVLAMNEAHRVLADGGIFVAIGDKMMDEAEIERFENDGIRDYEGMPYTEETLRSWFDECDFDDVQLVPVKYQDGMENMGMEALIADHGDNAVIYGVKQ